MANAALTIVVEALALRASHPWAPARDLLDLVMRGHEGTCIDFGVAGAPPERFALVVAEAFDRVMTPLEWASFAGPKADPAFRASILHIWATEVWPRFLNRYDVSSP